MYLNVRKAKELIVDFTKKKGELSALSIKRETVGMVDS